ncbi:MAG: acetoacetate decarboxylase family protein [Pseudomonadota bacterium]
MLPFVRPFFLLCAAFLSSAPAAARDWYSAGYGQVTVRAFVVQEDEAAVRALLPAPLTLAPAFEGREDGRHPLIVLFSTATPKKAHLMQFLIDMTYQEFAVFIPHVRHPDIEGDLLHSLILYLDSRPAVWMGRWPYRFPKILAPVAQGEGTQFGQFDVLQENRTRLVALEYTLDRDVPLADLQPEIARLDRWMSLPLINGSRKFTCARMDWEIVNHSQVARLDGTLAWQEQWLADARRLPPPAGTLAGVKLETLWHLSMPFDCDRLPTRH